MRFHRFSGAGTLAVVCLLVGAALAAAGALASAVLLTGLRNEAKARELAPTPA